MLIGNKDDAIIIKLYRSRVGVNVGIKVDPIVEEFFRKWGGGGQDDVRAVGAHRMWRGPDGQVTPLRIWTFQNREEEDAGYTLFQPGGPLMTESNIVNMSFLRLVGASEPGGVEFTCDMVISRAELDRIAQRVRRASEMFYAEYIQPVGMRIRVTTSADEIR